MLVFLCVFSFEDVSPRFNGEFLMPRSDASKNAANQPQGSHVSLESPTLCDICSHLPCVS